MMPGKNSEPSHPGRSLFVVLWALLLLGYGIHLWYASQLKSPLLWYGIALDPAPGGVKVLRLSEKSPYFRSGLRPGDQVLWCQDQRGERFPFASIRGRVEAMKHIGFGDPWALVVSRPAAGGGSSTVRVDLPPADQPPAFFDNFISHLQTNLPLFLINLLAAALIGFRRGIGPVARSAAYLMLCFASLNVSENYLMRLPAGLFEGVSLVYMLCASSLGSCFLRFFLRFPSDSPLERRLPWLKTFAFLAGAVFAVWNYWLLLNFAKLPAYDFVALYASISLPDNTMNVLFVLLSLTGLLSLVLNIRQAGSPGEKRRLTLLLTTCVVGLLPWQTIYLSGVLFGFNSFPGWFNTGAILCRILFPLFFAWAVVKHQLFGIRFILKRSLRFALLSRGVLFAEGMILFTVLYLALQPLFAASTGTGFQSVLAVSAAAAAIGVVTLLGHANRGLMAFFERRYFRESHDVRSTLAAFSAEMRNHCLAPDRMLAALMETVGRVVHPRRLLICFRSANLLRLPADTEGVRSLRRQAAGARGDAFLVAGDMRHGHDGTISALCPAPVPLVFDLESPVGRVLARLGDDLDAVGTELSRYLPKRGGGEAEAADARLFLEAHIRRAVPLYAGNAIAGFVCLGEKLSEEPWSAEDVEFVQALAQLAASALENAVLLQQFREQEHLLREMEIARQVQTNLFPSVPVPTRGIDYYGLCVPARYVGGDCYDFQRVGADQLSLALGDVSGKGVSAALVMSGLLAALRMQLAIRGGLPGEVMGEINRHLCVSGEDHRLATLFLGVFDPPGRRLTYVSAGHNPPLVFRAAGGDGTPETLAVSGLMLGVLPEAEYAATPVDLGPGDLLVVYSDGVSEAMDFAWDQYGEERLRAFVGSRRDLPLPELAEALLQDIRLFAGEAPQSDDITLVLARGVR